MRLVEVVVVGDLDGEAVGVFGAGSVVAALGRLARVGVLGLGGEGDVVVDELAPGDQHDGDGVVVEALVLMHRAGHGTGRGEGRALKDNIR